MHQLRAAVAEPSPDESIRLMCFCVFDGCARVVIEVESEDVAWDLCQQMGWVFIGCLED
jgi:hypothetical protein